MYMNIYLNHLKRSVCRILHVPPAIYVVVVMDKMRRFMLCGGKNK